MQQCHVDVGVGCVSGWKLAQACGIFRDGVNLPGKRRRLSERWEHVGVRSTILHTVHAYHLCFFPFFLTQISTLLLSF